MPSTVYSWLSAFSLTDGQKTEKKNTVLSFRRIIWVNSFSFLTEWDVHGGAEVLSECKSHNTTQMPKVKKTKQNTKATWEVSFNRKTHGWTWANLSISRMAIEWPALLCVAFVWNECVQLTLLKQNFCFHLILSTNRTKAEMNTSQSEAQKGREGHSIAILRKAKISFPRFVDASN